MRDRRDSSTWHVADGLADLLAAAGRGEEAIEVLQSSDRPSRSINRLALLLIQQSRISEALELFDGAARAKEAAKKEADAQFWFRFRAEDPGAASQAS